MEGICRSILKWTGWVPWYGPLVAELTTSSLATVALKSTWSSSGLVWFLFWWWCNLGISPKLLRKYILPGSASYHIYSKPRSTAVYRRHGFLLWMISPACRSYIHPSCFQIFLRTSRWRVVDTFSDVFEAKWHDFVTISSPIRYERWLLLVFWMHYYVVIFGEASMKERNSFLSIASTMRSMCGKGKLSFL